MIAETVTITIIDGGEDRGEFAAEMLKRRKALRLSQPVAAQRAGLGTSRWNHYEKDLECISKSFYKRPTRKPETVWRIALVLDWPVEEAFQAARLPFDPNQPPPMEVPEKEDDEVVVSLFRSLPKQTRGRVLNQLRKLGPGDDLDLLAS